MSVLLIPVKTAAPVQTEQVTINVTVQMDGLDLNVLTVGI